MNEEMKASVEAHIKHYLDSVPIVVKCSHCGEIDVFANQDQAGQVPELLHRYGWRLAPVGRLGGNERPTGGTLACPACAFRSLGEYKTEICGCCDIEMTTDRGPFGPECRKLFDVELEGDADGPDLSRDLRDHMGCGDARTNHQKRVRHNAAIKAHESRRNAE